MPRTHCRRLLSATLLGICLGAAPTWAQEAPPAPGAPATLPEPVAIAPEAEEQAPDVPLIAPGAPGTPVRPFAPRSGQFPGAGAPGMPPPTPFAPMRPLTPALSKKTATLMALRELRMRRFTAGDIETALKYLKSLREAEKALQSRSEQALDEEIKAFLALSADDPLPPESGAKMERELERYRQQEETSWQELERSIGRPKTEGLRHLLGRFIPPNAFPIIPADAVPMPGAGSPAGAIRGRQGNRNPNRTPSPAPGAPTGAPEAGDVIAPPTPAPPDDPTPLSGPRLQPPPAPDNAPTELPGAAGAPVPLTGQLPGTGAAGQPPRPLRAPGAMNLRERQRSQRPALAALLSSPLLSLDDLIKLLEEKRAAMRR